MAERIPEELMEELTERKDKFVSNVYKAKIDHFILMVGGEPPKDAEAAEEFQARKDSMKSNR